AGESPAFFFPFPLILPLPAALRESPITTATSRLPPPHHGHVDCACRRRAVTARLRLPAYRRLVLSRVLSRLRDAILFTCHPPLPARRSRLLLPGPGEKGDVDNGVTRRLCPLPRRLFALSSPRTRRLHMLSLCSHRMSAAACVPMARIVVHRCASSPAGATLPS
ncbi:hypothetical protein V8E53_006126, partial [Lactarius tabidus]